MKNEKFLIEEEYSIDINRPLNCPSSEVYPWESNFNFLRGNSHEPFCLGNRLRSFGFEIEFSKLLDKQIPSYLHRSDYFVLTISSGTSHGIRIYF